ncbi:MAG: TIGR03087 family PEP-CTERM/XrtA system glycosyltransferase [Gammaproteobacteria bacterium]|nr:TIGR03087 family PEP-CTERM/XrtA system glycosyltransferase [Gammaproteobacteria bacterium]
MRVLFICHRFPFPPKRGGKIRPFNIIDHFTRSGHEVTVCSLARDPAEAEDGKGLEQHCKHFEVSVTGRVLPALRMVARLPTLVPSSMGYFYTRELQQRVNRQLQDNDYDLIFVHCSSVAQFVNKVTGIPKILDFGDMDSKKWQIYSSFKPFPLSWGYWYEGIKLERAEKQLARQFDLCTCTTKAELETLDSYSAARQTDWFPNGVDAIYFKPLGTSPRPTAIGFVGRMDYYPNQRGMLDFCADVLPLLQQEKPDLELFIIGAEPSAAIRELGQLRGVTVTGSVDDIRPHVQLCQLTVAPLAIARGTQNKILESMAQGVPVVCSPEAAGGVDAEPERHLLVASTPTEYCTQIMRLLKDPDFRNTLSEQGRQRALSHHDWAHSMQRLDQIVQKLVGNSERAPT